MVAGRTVIHSARLVSGGVTTPDSWVVFENGLVAEVGSGRGWQAHAGAATVADTRAEKLPNGVTVTDAAGRWLTPGFIDIHCHGGASASFDNGADGIRTALSLHRKHGTTRTVLSLVTAKLEELETRLAAVADATEQDPLILGAHLEGPFLDVAFRGAHDPSLLRTPDPHSIARILEAGRGHIRQITLAPELPGAYGAIRKLVAEGVAVAVGHTAADYDTALAAFGAGASILTHAFNGMRGIHHRAPGPVGAAIHSNDVTLEIVNDGTHVHPDVVRLAFAGAPGRVALITDAMAAAGATDGTYALGSLTVAVSKGVARLTTDNSIAGSTLTLDASLRRAVANVGVSIEDAVMALTETPARAIGRSGDLGRLAVGYLADAVMLSETLEVESVYTAGQRLL